MSDQRFLKLIIRGMPMVINSQHAHCLENRFSIFDHSHAKSPVRLAYGYIELEGHTIACYSFDERFSPSGHPTESEQIILVIKHKLGLFGISCDDIRPLTAAIKLFSIPESMTVQPSPFSHYARTAGSADDDCLAVLDPGALINYLDHFNQHTRPAINGAASH